MRVMVNYDSSDSGININYGSDGCISDIISDGISDSINDGTNGDINDNMGGNNDGSDGDINDSINYGISGGIYNDHLMVLIKIVKILMMLVLTMSLVV